MSTFMYRLSMVGHYTVKVASDMSFTADVKFGDEDKDAEKPSIRLALLVKYEGIDRTLRIHHITLDDMPEMFSCFMSGRPYKDLVLKYIEVGPKMMRFRVAITSYKNEGAFAIELPFGDSYGELELSDRHYSEVYKFKWIHGVLFTIHQTVRFVRKCFQFKFGNRGETMPANADFNDEIVTVSEETPIEVRHYFDDD